MSKFKLLFAVMCLSMMATPVWASGTATHFFKTHPNLIDAEEQGDSVLFANKQIGLEFKKSDSGFQIGRLYGVALNQDFLTEATGNIFEITMTLDPKHVGKDERWGTKEGAFGIMEDMAGKAFTIDSQAGKKISWGREGNDTESVLHLNWKEIDVKDDKGAMDVEVTVTLRAGDSLSYWRINIRNRSRRYGIERVRFPLLSLAPIGKAEDNTFIFPMWRGCLVDNPFNYPKGLNEGFHARGAFYPADFNMQFQALYNRNSGKGIYLGTRDPAPSLMNIQIANTSSEISWRPGHFPPNITFSEEDFLLPYDCVIGPFKGDWFDACQIYRKWAIKQSWCSKGPLTTRKDIPKWFKESPLQLYTHLTDSATGVAPGPRSREKNMPIAAEHFREFLEWAGMPLAANFYGWLEPNHDISTYSVPFNGCRTRTHGRWSGQIAENAHDGSYPKVPAIQNFSAECKSLREIGGIVSPYVALQLFDNPPVLSGGF